jgi:hypothetical protein
LLYTGAPRAHCCPRSPREKPNRPITRRRRENSAECLEKLRAVRENLLRALQLAELVTLRERKKSDMYVSGRWMRAHLSTPGACLLSKVYRVLLYDTQLANVMLVCRG